MSAELLAALVVFSFVTSITPGPNNMMLLASGVNFGFRRTVPHMLGIALGCVLMILLVGIGLGGLFAAIPGLYLVLRWVGAAYLLFLAWRLARGGSLNVGSAGPEPMGFWPAVAFQWVNPKAWVMVVGAVTTYVPQDGFFANLVVTATVFEIVGLPSIAVWAGFGVALRGVLDRPWRRQAFNVTAAALLVASLYPLLM